MFNRARRQQLAFIAVLVILTPEIRGCSCIYDFSEFTPHYLTIFDRILECRPFEVTKSDNRLYYRAVVTKTYWGTRSDTVLLRTGEYGAMCGMPLDLGETYLVYGNGQSTIDFNSCSRSRRLSGRHHSLEEIRNLDSVYTVIHGEYKRYSGEFLQAYYERAYALECAYLDTISRLVNGKLETRFSNGRISGTLEFRNGLLGGPATFYFPNGRKYAGGTFVNNKKSGKWTEFRFWKYHNDPSSYYASEQGKYVNGERRGKWKTKMIEGKWRDAKGFPGYRRRTTYK